VAQMKRPRSLASFVLLNCSSLLLLTTLHLCAEFLQPAPLHSLMHLVCPSAANAAFASFRLLTLLLASLTLLALLSFSSVFFSLHFLYVSAGSTFVTPTSTIIQSNLEVPSLKIGTLDVQVAITDVQAQVALYSADSKAIADLQTVTAQLSSLP
jgi:hypothetical protein